MRTFLLAFVCFLITYIGGGVLPESNNSVFSPTALAQVTPPHCPPCGICEQVGVEVIGDSNEEDCGTTLPSGNPCDGEAEIFTVYGMFEGRDKLVKTQTTCSGYTPSGDPCNDMVDSFMVVQNWCYPIGQTPSHYTCENGECKFKNACGVSTCDDDQDCPCPEGQTNPHFICSGTFCEQVDSCGVSTCDPSIEPEFCNEGCNWSCEEARCVGVGCESPIIVDILGNGFNLTDGNNGVDFDIDGNGTRERIAWASINSDDAFLALDRDGNGTIDSGKELFGNFTPQPRSRNRNGFIALAEFDKPRNGGNGDGLISIGDAIFLSLRMWVDWNHNGFSEANELFTLPSVGLMSVDLDYRESRRRDRHGNLFLYRAKVRDARGAQLGRWAYDVFLIAPR